MAIRTAVVASAAGLHARPAAVFVEKAREVGVPVRISTDGMPAINATSILMVMSLGAGQGTTVTLEAEGVGAAEALEILANIIETELDSAH